MGKEVLGVTRRRRYRNIKKYLNISSLSVGVFLATIMRVRKLSDKSGTQISVVSLADIQKAPVPVNKHATKLEKLSS